MQIKRTDDSRFNGLKDYDFQPNYVEITDGLRLHYLDEGQSDAAPVLCMHGEPTWSYLYRHMIPVFATAGHRVIAPDLIGFGRSDKPMARSDYTYARHVAWMSEALEKLDLRNITLVCQDWGGLIGLRLWAAMPERFARIVVANTALPTGDQPMGEAFKAWREYRQSVPEFNSGRIVYGGTSQKIDEAEVAAYNAPFPDDDYLAGARQFPTLVPDGADDPEAPANRAAWGVIRELKTPLLPVFGAEDKIMAGVDKVFQKLAPGAAGMPHAVLQHAGHFIQEDAGWELAGMVNGFVARTS